MLIEAINSWIHSNNGKFRGNESEMQKLLIQIRGNCSHAQQIRQNVKQPVRKDHLPLPSINNDED